MTTIIDLTEFGFTPTESRTYNALLDLGPSSGYALARALGIARANTYHAIEQLRAKGAATSPPDQPSSVRAVRPEILAELLTARQRARLDQLDDQVRRRGDSTGAEGIVPIESGRVLGDLAARIIVREEGSLRAIAPADFYATTAAAWRKRAADDRPSDRWWYGEGPGLGTNEIPSARVLGQFRGAAILLSGANSAICATVSGTVTGWLAHDSLRLGLASCAVANLIST